MDSPKCQNCDSETEWYGWLHGWLCTACEAQNLEEASDEEDLEVQEQQHRS